MSSSGRVVRHQRFDREATKITEIKDPLARAAAAKAWCDVHGTNVCLMALSFSQRVPSVERHVRHVCDVIRLALTSHPILHVLLSSVDEAVGVPATGDPLLPLVALWQVRDDRDQYFATLKDWVATRAEIDGPCASAAWPIAVFALSSIPDLATPLLDLLGQLSAQRPCHSSTCWACNGTWRALYALRRYAADDHSAIDALETNAILQDDQACTIARKQRLPPRLLDAARVAVACASDDSVAVRALGLLFASSADHPQAVDALAKWVLENGARAGVLHGATWIDGACVGGEGWGRKTRPKKLLSLSAALWRRDNQSHCHLLSRLLSSPDDIATWEYVRECVAEHVLQRALDSSAPDAERRRALDALSVLHPQGNDSFAKALGKLYTHETLGARARQVARDWRRGDCRTEDGELAVDEAWTVFWVE